MTFDHQHIVLLGGTAGIGLAAAQAAAAEGAAVTVVSRSAARVDAALEQLPAGAEGRTADLGDEGAIRGLFAEIGPFDHLVYTAGGPLLVAPLGDVSLDDARRALDVRVWGAYAAAKHAAPSIRPGGSITLTTGSAGERPMAGWTVGALVCGAIVSLTRALAVELAPLRVNVVSPGLVRTDLWAGMDEDEREGLFATFAQQLPVGRIGEPADVAEAFLYLMRNGYATGTVVSTDGGGVLV